MVEDWDLTSLQVVMHRWAGRRATGPLRSRRHIELGAQFRETRGDQESSQRSLSPVSDLPAERMRLAGPLHGATLSFVEDAKAGVQGHGQARLRRSGGGGD